MIDCVNQHCRRANRDVTMTTDESSSTAEAVSDSSLADYGPKLDLAFKEGETIKISITVSVLSSTYIATMIML